ncbi:S66 peptidase family protein [Coprobacter tertius]|uniref:LD-carboxypeptidase n=1 Tax=Coprobacter tertius TaxID=2944915 RepID=A0ABT1MMC7_9BACT|nr:LD-carboxypeptidase [Coprobacter tertius]MCP9612411.1 LD-carboxypeptidase [Coprobacter tertius]
MKRPEYLKQGDKIAIISPSGKVERRYIEGAERTLREWGLEPIIAMHCLSECGRFAGKDEARLQDLKEVLCNPSIRAVLCSRGGYGAIRLLEKIDTSWISDNPKWLIGYSDISALHAIFRKAGVISLHAPMAKHLTDNSDNMPAIVMRDLLFGKWPVYRTKTHPLNRFGKSEGTLFGGNLSVLFGLRGTPYDQISEGDILFIEDIAERPYHLERMMYNLKMSGILSKLSGFIVGKFTDYEEDLSIGKTVYEMMAEMVAPYDYPVCFDFPIGHVPMNFPIPESAEAQLTVSENGAVLKIISE